MSVKYMVILGLIALNFFCSNLVEAMMPAAATCTVTTAGLAFGAYNPSSPSPDDSTATFSIVCTGGPQNNFTLAASAGNSNNILARYMLGPSASQLNYNMYINSSLTTIWGNGTTGSLITFSGPCRARNNCRATAYGRILAGIYSAAVGSYSDTITTTLTVN